ncbi:CPBP family intramembrane metalloprotease [Bacillus cereus]|uniref:CPBP family intramembrane metalloprotease n=1 Tax=Bacillus nitratireducens TaxID=2026193 RepID=A0ABU6PKF2_9BACI|nr:CPBP family intramembrane glutamic endopeptidase [Bacillus nitratireducens]MED4681743.1 CPBP family intramembrane metalloprotease [Bacillus nitratireducens]PGM85015.1 CPBP family intramembrane metalloprotease [Bacillus cereus]PGW34428.1 CPBP family intramembrane metalloprotease [Bacillus cereus]
MNVKRLVEKGKWVLMTTGLAIVSSLVFSYIKGYFGIDTGNAEQVNAKVELNIFYLIVPLLIAPVIEEWISRKILPLGIEKLFERINRTTAIVIANGIFAAVHFDWFFFPYFVNGCLYAWSYEKTGDIKVPIVAHISFNSFVFLATSL